MINKAAQYFIRFGHLDLPKLGNIKWQKKEAQWQDGVLYAPQESIEFEPMEVKPSKQFYIYLADQLCISNDQAAIQWEEKFNSFTTSMNDSIEIGNLGVISKVNGETIWTSNYDASKYYKDIHLASSVISETLITTDEKSKKDNWVWWALVFVVLAIISIFYKYL